LVDLILGIGGIGVRVDIFMANIGAFNRFSLNLEEMLLKGKCPQK